MHAGADFLDWIRDEPPGGVAIFSGRNRGKIDRIIAALETGLHVPGWTADPGIVEQSCSRLSANPSSCATSVTDEAPMLTGGCYCGAIRYEADGTPRHETNCHCSICRRTTGAPFVTWFSVQSTHFRIVNGLPARFSSTEKGTRSFCPRCGTQIAFEHVDFPGLIDITTSSLDNPDLVPPRYNTRTSSRLKWIVQAGLPEYWESRQQG